MKNWTQKPAKISNAHLIIMLNLKFILQNQELMEENCKKRNLRVNFDLIRKLSSERLSTLQSMEKLQAKINQISKQIKKHGKNENTELIAKAQSLKEKLKIEKEKNKETSKKLKKELLKIPNLIHANTPIGKLEKDNKEMEKIGKIPDFNFKPKSHLDIGKNLDIIDFESGSKTTGNKFYFLKNEGLMLDMALTQYAIEILKKEGFELFLTPDLAKIELIEKLGYVPRGPETQIYKIENSDLGLIGTAEITLGGLLKDKILSAKELPVKFAGLSHCFRTEAGTYGKASKGLYRVHQFDKTEMFVFCLPKESDKMLKYLLGIEKKIFQSLGLPLKIINCCSGDLGAPAYQKFDIEAWMPEAKKWGEITSASNCTDFQARRLNIKFKDKNNKTKFVHTLNATAIATPRAIIAILENFQQKDGSVLIPKPLQKWMGIKKITAPKI